MPDFRVIVSDGDKGAAYQIEVSDNQANMFIGKKIGDMMDGDVLKLPGYSLQITGGTDKDGFPMRKGLSGPNRRNILISSGVGFKSPVKGMRRRRAIRGEEISSVIGQINVVVAQTGNKSLDELLSGKSEEPEVTEIEESEE
ncbi:MAG: 30S ribosomal protein S6e [Methanosarcinales archaeon]|nr:30S ribosomal protein S6e [Methanosarcinales archaeon]